MNDMRIVAATIYVFYRGMYMHATTMHLHLVVLSADHLDQGVYVVQPALDLGGVDEGAQVGHAGADHLVLEVHRQSQPGRQNGHFII